jgi:hypothetical protein
MNYIVDCTIGSSGIIHLSKAKWRNLDKTYLGKALLIKAEINLLVKT